MISTGLMYRLFKKFNPSLFKIVLVGDVNQIPPIDKGNFFRSLFNCSYIPKVCLEKNFRVDQEYGQEIIRNANLLVSPYRNLKEYPLLDIKSKSFNILKGGRKTLNSILTQLHSKCIDVSELTVLTLYNDDVKWINSMFKRILYPNNKDGIWHINDRVMITRNNSKSNVANGDLGYVTEIEKTYLKISLDKSKDEEDVEVDYDDVIHAYSFTINKSQGSEYETVILYIPKSENNSFFLNINLIYTAITRAKKWFGS